MKNRKYRLLILGSLLLIVYCLNTAYGASTPQLSSPAQTQATVTLSWTPTDGGSFSKYEAFYSTGLNESWIKFWTSTDQSETSTVITGLFPNITYYFKVEESNQLSTISSNVLTVRSKPRPQLEVTANTTTTANLQWTAYNTYSSLMPFRSYILQMRPLNGSWSTLTTSTDVSQSTYNVTGLSAGTYEFQLIEKIGRQGYLACSNIANLTVSGPNSPDPIFTPSSPWFIVAMASAVCVVGIVVGLKFAREHKKSHR